MKRTVKKLGWVLAAALIIANGTAPMQALRMAREGAVSTQWLQMHLGWLEASEKTQEAATVRSAFQDEAPLQATTLSLGGIPLAQTAVYDAQTLQVIPGGESIGIAIQTEGALVVAHAGFSNPEGKVVNPAAAAGIRVGDIILSVNGVLIRDAAHMTALIAEAMPQPVELTLARKEETFTAEVTPQMDATDQTYRLGIWVRDSMLGLGTLSFAMESGAFGALGHGISDADTGDLLHVRTGDVYTSRILDVRQSTPGEAGGVQGSFSAEGHRIGHFEVNCAFGIFGELDQAYLSQLSNEATAIGGRDVIHTGEAILLTTLDDTGVQAYTCTIERLYRQQQAETKGMVIRITDEVLLAKTGGIVQGMSGSPILQDGLLVGAVTHVFVNDPTRGYGIYIETMLSMTG